MDHQQATQQRMVRLEFAVFGLDGQSGMAQDVKSQGADLREVRQQVRDFRMVLETSLAVARWVLLAIGVVVGLMSSGSIAGLLAGLHKLLTG